jgi:DNA-binding FrmR family transcriptional regulator
MNEMDIEGLINTPGADHRSHLNRLKRIQGQLQNIINLVEDEKYCINIMHKSKAVRNALRSFEYSVLDAHFRKCVSKTILEGDIEACDKKIDEIMTIIKNNH